MDADHAHPIPPERPAAFIVIFDPRNPTDPYAVGPFPSRAHAEAYALTDPDAGNHGVQGQTFIVTELNAPATYTLKPPCFTDAQHQRAELEGWSIFEHADGDSYIERIDELDLLPSDAAAYPLARRMGLKVSGIGRVIGKNKVRVAPTRRRST
jgi:hypothetical protein